MMKHLFYAMVVVIGGAPAFAAPVTKTEPKPKGTDAIRSALDKVDNWEFTNVSLASLIQTLSEKFNISITVDRNTLAMMGVEADSINIDVKLKNAKLRTLIRTMLADYGLTCGIVGQSVLITTEEGLIHRQLKQRIDVDLNKVPAQQAILDLAKQTGVNLVIDPRVTKTKAVETPITLEASDVPVEAAIRLVCELSDLKPTRIGNVIFVTTEARADKLKDGDLAPPLNPLNPLIGGLAGGGIAAPLPPMVLPGGAEKAVEAEPAKQKDEPKKD